jgi:hypothetical protein
MMYLMNMKNVGYVIQMKNKVFRYKDTNKFNNKVINYIV